MTITLNNRLGSRSIRHMNLIVADIGDDQVIFEFTGKGIPGAVTVIKEDYEKNGKWSYSTWTVELADGMDAFTWPQDWEMGTYLTAKTWEAALEQVRYRASRHSLTGAITLTDAAVERFIRARIGKTAAKLDAAEAERTQDPTPLLEELLAAQAELSEAQQAQAAAEAERSRMANEVQAAIDARAAAERARTDAAATAARVAKAKQAMAKGASLADLHALLEAA